MESDAIVVQLLESILPIFDLHVSAQTGMPNMVVIDKSSELVSQPS